MTADLGYTALQTAVYFLPLGVTEFLVNMVLPHLLGPVGTVTLLVISWILALIGIILLSLIESAGDYWLFCFPGMIVYVVGIGAVYYVANVTVVGTAPLNVQGAVAGVFNVRKPTA